MLITNILLGVGTAIMWASALVEKDKQRQKNNTLAYVAGLAAIVVLNVVNIFAA